MRASIGGIFDESAALAEIASLLPDASLTWAAVLELAMSTPRHGRRPGMTAASRVGAQQIELQPTRWTAEDTEFLDPNAMAHPLPAPVRLMVDHREPGEMVDRLRAIQNLEIEIAELGIGDSLVENHLVIERKTIADFVTSITEDAKRLFH